MTAAMSSSSHSHPPAAAALLEQQRCWIYGWAYRLLQSHDDALDATQSVLLKTLADGAEPQSCSWLRRVTVNHCVDLIRRRRRQRWALPATGRAGQPGEAGRSSPAASEPLECAERRRVVVAALQQLSDAQRAVVIAKIFDGDTFEAIAEDLGTSASTVKTHYLRGLRRMRELLGAAGAEVLS